MDIELTLSLEWRGGGGGFSCTTSFDEEVDGRCDFGDATRGGGDVVRSWGEPDRIDEVTRGEAGPRGDIGGDTAGNGFPVSGWGGDAGFVTRFGARDGNESSSFRA